ncbi:MAG TPA: lipid II flippase MurJ, partial [Acidimicrobiales bacterium]
TNSVPNLVFELVAAGVLQAVLVPELFEVLDRRGRAEGGRVAGVVLGGLLTVLGGAMLLGALLAPLVSRALFAGAPASVRADQVWLGTVFLWIFLPQVLFYAGGMVATAMLNADNRFAVPAFAPVLNNVVVIGAYLTFGALRAGEEPSLHLSPLEVAVLAGGTTLGVVAFTAAPVVAAARRGLVLRPIVAFDDPDLRRLARAGLWAGLFLGLTQVLLVAALVCGATVEGGAVVYQLGYTYFLLPHALVAIPVFTALYPSLSRTAQAGDDPAFTSLVRRGVQAVWVLELPAMVAMVVLGTPAARLTLFGESASSVDAVAATMAAFAVGLAPYGLFLLLTRASYARGDAKLPTVVHLAATVLGVAGMALATAVLDGDARIAGLAGAHSAAYLLAAVALGVALRRRTGAGAGPLVDRGVAVGAAVAAAAAAASAVGMLAPVDQVFDAGS